MLAPKAFALAKEALAKQAKQVVRWWATITKNATEYFQEWVATFTADASTSAPTSTSTAVAEMEVEVEAPVPAPHSSASAPAQEAHGNEAQCLTAPVAAADYAANLEHDVEPCSPTTTVAIVDSAAGLEYEVLQRGPTAYVAVVECTAADGQDHGAREGESVNSDIISDGPRGVFMHFLAWVRDGTASDDMWILHNDNHAAREADKASALFLWKQFARDAFNIVELNRVIRLQDEGHEAQRLPAYAA